jgi:class 3 adenylate cyclase
VEVAPVRYVPGPDGAIAYQQWGDGDVEMLLMTSWPTSVDNIWEHPGRVRFLTTQGALARVTRFDARGFGASDRRLSESLGRVDLWAEDILRVLNYLGLDRVVLAAENLATHPAILFAGTHPERVDKLVLWNGFARLLRADDYPIGHPEEVVVAHVERVRNEWGTGAVTALRVPTLAQGAADPGFLARTERLGASRADAVVMSEVEFRSDVRSDLPAASMPALVVHTGDFFFCGEEHCRYVADRLPDAHLVCAPSRSFYWGEEAFDEYAAFVRATPLPERDVAAILFTDIVGSTPRAIELGDRRWREVLDGLDAFVEVEVRRSGGRLVKQTGDGHVVAFERPADAVEAAARVLRGAATFEVALRAGVHVGEIESRKGGDIAGIAVHVAQRVAGSATGGELLVSKAVADLLAGSRHAFEDRGEHDLKGLEGRWQLFGLRP